jgi:hypothetical protein
MLIDGFGQVFGLSEVSFILMIREGSLFFCFHIFGTMDTGRLGQPRRSWCWDCSIRVACGNFIRLSIIAEEFKGRGLAFRSDFFYGFFYEASREYPAIIRFFSDDRLYDVFDGTERNLERIHQTHFYGVHS